jgi:mRNA-degrading endonuclease RelE of RelBE toxin-antitoxin system
MLEGMRPPKLERKSRVQEILEKLDPKDQEILVAALHDMRWSGIQLALELRKRGLDVSSATIQRYRVQNGITR